MASDGGSADSEKKPDAASKPKEVEPEKDATGATGTTTEPPAATPAGATPASLGERQVQAKSEVGAADDPAEAAADATADRVMRMPEPEAPAGAGAEPQAAAPQPAAPPQQEAKVQRAPDPAAEAQPAPAAPAPAPAAAAPDREPAGAEVEPEAEPPAPEGQQPARSAPEVPEKTQQYLEATAGTGDPLPEKPRKYFETRMKHDLGHVGIHDDAAADEAAKAVDALAFTKGRDIYFRSGAFDPESEAGKRLLAHELAHVVQQRPGINRKPAPGTPGTPVIRRTPPTPAAGGGAGAAQSIALPGGLPDAEKATYQGPNATIDTGKRTLHLDEVYVPAFKLDQMTPPLAWSPKPRTDAYRTKWATEAGTKLQTPVKAAAERLGQTDPVLYFQRTAAFPLFGSPEDIALGLTSLPFDKTGKKHSYDVDHKREVVLGGEDNPGQADKLWLLDSKKNKGSGAAIAGSVRRDVGMVVAAIKNKVRKPPSDKEVLASYGLTFGQAKAGPNPRQKEAADVWTGKLSSTDSWSLEEMGTTTALSWLEDMNKTNRDKVRGSAGALSLSTRRGGGGSIRRVPYDTTSGVVKGTIFGAGVDVKLAKYTATSKPTPGQEVGLVVVYFNKGNEHLSMLERTFPIVGVAGVEYGGMLDTASIREVGKLSHRKFSPVQLDEAEVDLDKGLVARGRIPKPSIPLLENVEIGLTVEGDTVGLEAVITGDQLALPGPFKVQGGSITLSADKNGIGVEGDINFEIEKLAKGKIGAGGSTKRTRPGFAMKGSLDFEPKMFTEARLGLSYADGKWGVEGKLAVGKDKIKGIRSASVAVTVDDGKVDAAGEFETSIKGLDKGKVAFKYDPATGMEVTGQIELGEGIPGIKSGKLDATIKEGAEGYSLSGGIVVEPSVPGLTGTITGRYADGAFLVEADLGYERDIAKGRIKVGVTNQAVTEGRPAGPPVEGGALRAYGGGEVTLTITPWMQGTVGLQLKENGQIEVKGKVALPDHFDVFPEKKVSKEVFSIGIDIPIVGVAVAGQRIGIFATIRGGLNVSAGFGPGQLKGLALEVTYNPDDPAATHVVGTGTFAVPAHAGLRLNVDGGLGIGIPVVSATAGVSIYGEVGLAGEASASAKIDWSPGPGFVLDATGSVSVTPRFKFGVDAFVDVSADLWVTTIELYHQTWKLAEFEYGSDMTFGLVFPIHYEQGKPFDLSFDQIQWTYPTIEPSELLGGLMKQLVG